MKSSSMMKSLRRWVDLVSSETARLLISSGYHSDFIAQVRFHHFISFRGFKSICRNAENIFFIVFRHLNHQRWALDRPPFYNFRKRVDGRFFTGIIKIVFEMTAKAVNLDYPSCNRSKESI